MREVHIVYQTTRCESEDITLIVREPKAAYASLERAEAFAESFDGEVVSVPYDDTRSYVTPIIGQRAEEVDE